MSHWYVQTVSGAKRYIQLKKNGEESKRVLRAKAVVDGAVESVNTILDQASEIGGLRQWVAKLAVEAGVEAGNVQAGMALCAARREEAANRGTEYHGAIEMTLKTGTLPGDPALANACKAAAGILLDRHLSAYDSEACFVFKGEVEGVHYAFGGTPDIASPTWLLDWKTVGEGGRDPKIEGSGAASRLSARD